MSKQVLIVGGHGNVSLRLARLLSPNHKITSVIRNPDHAEDIKAAGATPLVLSLEDSPVEEFTKSFEEIVPDVIYFSAGGGGKAGTDSQGSEVVASERTKRVDYEGAVKIFDAIDAIKGKKPMLILVSAVDLRDPDKIPDHYTDEDKAISTRVRRAIPDYIKWKYEADKNLVQRTGFKWFILRAGGLNSKPGTGKAEIGRTHITQAISRDDVALTLSLLIDREDAAGLALDLVGGETPIAEALDKAIKKGETDFLG